MPQSIIPHPELLKDKKWRLQNLYKITNKEGFEVNFTLNWAQEELLDKFWYQMLILKARQLGVTTFFVISFLDDCFWLDNISAGVIADKRESSEEIFKKKAKFAYDRMPSWTRLFNSATNDRSGELAFRNGSSYRVSTGFRSGTCQRLLISEFGKICAKSPDVAKEIVTGSLNTVSKDQIIVIESTAEGREGYFYDFSKESEALMCSGKKLSPMQMRFFFFPWWKEKSYSEQDESVLVTKEVNEYIDNLEIEIGVNILPEQRRWYELKSRTMQDNMKQEYPSTANEAFEASNEGLYYGKQIAKLRADGHITKVPYQESSLVHISFDIGYDDHTSIWFCQLLPGGQISVIDYYENCNEGAKFYADYLRGRQYSYGTMILPHDAKSHNPALGNSWYEVMSEMYTGQSIHVFEQKDISIFNGIQCVRSILGRCYFDEAKCAKGLAHLEAYKKEWNDKIGAYRDIPLHDSASHASDSFRYLAQGIELVGGGRLTPEKIKEMRQRHGYK
jgi:hypothetical protein